MAPKTSLATEIGSAVRAVLQQSEGGRQTRMKIGLVEPCDSLFPRLALRCVRDGLPCLPTGQANGISGTSHR